MEVTSVSFRFVSFSVSIPVIISCPAEGNSDCTKRKLYCDDVLCSPEERFNQLATSPLVAIVIDEHKVIDVIDVIDADVIDAPCTTQAEAVNHECSGTYTIHRL